MMQHDKRETMYLLLDHHLDLIIIQIHDLRIMDGEQIGFLIHETYSIKHDILPDLVIELKILSQ